jgi:hypothetical protein
MILLLLVLTVLDLGVLLDRKDRDREEDGNAFPASAPERDDDDDSTRALVHPHEVESLPRFLVDFQPLGKVPLLPKIASTISVFTQT